jgi:hypothetical protein
VAVFQTVGANFAGDRTEQRTTVFAEATLLNFQELTYILSASPATLNDRLLRGGPMAARPGGALQNLRWSSDPRRARVYGLELSRATDASGRHSAGMAVELEWRPAPAVRLRVGPSWQGGHTTDQYVQAVADPLATATSGVRYVFANVRQQEARLDTRVDWTFSPSSCSCSPSPRRATSRGTRSSPRRAPSPSRNTARSAARARRWQGGRRWTPTARAPPPPS